MVTATLQASFNKPSQQELDAFFDAAGDVNNAVVAEFLDKYPSAADEKNGGRTALVWAAMFGRTETAKLLLKNGADVNGKNEHGMTALMAAAANGYKDLVELLLYQGADMDAKKHTGETALMMAGEHRQPGTAALLARWAEKQKMLREEQRAQWLIDTDFSTGLKKPIPARRPLNFSNGVK